MNATAPLSESASVSLKWSAGTDRGGGRRNNEDAFLGLQFNAREILRLGKTGEASIEHLDFAFAVSDGMGGAAGGEHASQIAVEKITTLLPRSFALGAAGLTTGFADVLSELFDQIHRSLKEVGQSYEECAGMETTLSLCWFVPGRMYFAHIGDSRIYHLPAGGGLRQLSHDDTHVGWLLRSGKITEPAARRHPRRKVLQRALGGGNQFIEPQVGATPYRRGDIFLLCTDGLVEGLFDSHLAEFLKSGGPKPAAANPAGRLIKESLDRGTRDNLTAIVIQVI